MNELQIKQKAFLDETASHFNSSNRAISENKYKCRYSHEYNGGCAIGRHCTKETADELDKIMGAVFKNSIFDLLPEKLKTLGKLFLRDIQILHDTDINWNSEGLSDIFGKAEYNLICKVYILS